MYQDYFRDGFLRVLSTELRLSHIGTRFRRRWRSSSSSKTELLPRLRHDNFPLEASLPHCISGIVLMRAEKEMLLIDAGTHVTVMTDEIAMRNGTMFEHPGQAMSADLMPIHRELSISIRSR